MSDPSRHEAIREILIADATLSALVSEVIDDDGTEITLLKVRPEKLADLDNPPALIVELPGDVGELSLDGDASAGQLQFGVVAIGYSAKVAHQLAVEVKRILHDFRGGTAVGITFDPITWERTAIDHEPPDDDSTDDHDWFVETLTFNVWYRT